MIDPGRRNADLGFFVLEVEYSRFVVYNFMLFNEFNEAWAGNAVNPKVVLVLGGPGSGKSYIAERFVKHGFRLALMDQYFEALTRKKQQSAGNPSGKVNVSIADPAQKADYVWAAGKNDSRMATYMEKGYPFVTEKTGQNYGTIAQLKQLLETKGYDTYCIYVTVDVNTALHRNAARATRSLSDEDELRRTHQKVAGNMYPSKFGSGVSGMFGKDFFFEVKNNGTAESNAQIEKIVAEIIARPVRAMPRQESRMVSSKLKVNFRQYFEYYHESAMAGLNEPGVVKVIDKPQEQGNMLIYNVASTLEPGRKIMLLIPEAYRHLVVRDMVLAHRKGPFGHGEPHMKWEAEKSKWRDYYGAYTKVEAHDTQSGSWHTYIDDYGMGYKFAEHRPGEYEEETLHDWIRIAKVKPDAIRLTNPGNQRAKSHPTTGEKVDPMDQRSTSEIATLKVIFFPDVDLSHPDTKFYERYYSKVGGPQDSPAKFANFGGEKAELEPTYGNYGAGVYPNALVLAADWGRQGRRIKQIDGKYYFVMDKESYNQVASEMGDRAERANGGDTPHYNRSGREYVKVFPVTLDGGPGTQVRQNNTLIIDVPNEMAGHKLLQIEVMCGDTEFRPDRIPQQKPWKRLGYAHLHMGAQVKGGVQWFTASDGISVAPQMVAAAAPKKPIDLSAGDKIILKSEQDTTYVMGWRIAYS